MVEDDTTPGQISLSLDDHNIIDFDPGNEVLPSPVLSDASMTSNVQPQPAPIDYGRQTLYQSFDEFGIAPEMQALPADEALWRPFRSRRDFEFSEIALDAALNKHQIDRLLSLIAHISQGQTQITLTNETDLRMLR
ncbi:uncharacterized protein F5147DRAFT_781868 [Suillus discolor]|uniref:Uncharacterized protein n=1 Tax=Suillus discolor TaxID=1912936 RepID=A0A9P7ESI3_9AGAM|nr:uncharacterized protein F5147DRAFT_781868 [Suillus discolor]KAG2085835.1 hypothetical protein F5147DRAFT_781868 [Suillus discolor]